MFAKAEEAPASVQKMSPAAEAEPAAAETASLGGEAPAAPDGASAGAPAVLAHWAEPGGAEVQGGGEAVQRKESEEGESPVQLKGNGATEVSPGDIATMDMSAHGPAGDAQGLARKILLRRQYFGQHFKDGAVLQAKLTKYLQTLEQTPTSLRVMWLNGGYDVGESVKINQKTWKGWGSYKTVNAWMYGEEAKPGFLRRHTYKEQAAYALAERDAFFARLPDDATLQQKMGKKLCDSLTGKAKKALESVAGGGPVKVGGWLVSGMKGALALFQEADFLRALDRFKVSHSFGNTAADSVRMQLAMQLAAQANDAGKGSFTADEFMDAAGMLMDQLFIFVGNRMGKKFGDGWHVSGDDMYAE